MVDMVLKNWLFSFLFVLVYSVSGFSEPVHIVFDLDWTIFYSIDPNDPLQMDDKVIQVQGKHYRATDYTEQMLGYLVRNHPDVKISFFSGGERDRNLQLLESLKIDETRTALDIATHVFHREDLTIISLDKSMPFEMRNKKEIEKLIPDFDPDQVILIDDKPGFANKNVTAVSSLGTTTFTKRFDKSRSGLKYFPKDYQAWKLERDKALIWLALIQKGFQRPVGTSFSKWIENLWMGEHLKLMTPLPQQIREQKQGRQILAPLKCPSVYRAI